MNTPLRQMVLAATLASLLVSGCSTTGGTFTIFPTGHFLMDSTKQLASVAPVPAPTSRELEMTVLPAYYVAPGDVLLVEPVSIESTLRFPSDQRVLIDGTIDLERFGRPVVAGRTLEEIEEMIQHMIETVNGKPETVNVRLIDPQGAVYYVLGEVNTPGAYPLIGRETVLDGILTAGGLSQRASTCNIIVSRPTHPHSCRVVLPVCYREITQLGDTSTNYQLLPGDRVFVATRTVHENLMPFANRKPCALCGGVQCACPDPSFAEWGPNFRFLPDWIQPDATVDAPPTPPVEAVAPQTK